MALRAERRDSRERPASNDIAAYRSLFRYYASHARWCRQTYQCERAREWHFKALATLAMLQLVIAEAAQR
jgi:hypothetical protein